MINLLQGRAALLITIGLAIISVRDTAGEEIREEEDRGRHEIVLVEPEMEADDIVLDDITVTALRVRKRLKDTPVFTEVISRDDIQRSNASTVSDVLEDHGLMFTSNAMGDYITIQGMGGSRVLFLVDGRRVPGRVARRLNGATLPVGDVERIEIVRGSQSALYGSDGIGGVINVVTVPPSGDRSLTVRVRNSGLPPYKDPDGDNNSSGDASAFREQTVAAQATFSAGPLENRITLDGGKGELYLDERGARSILPEYRRIKAGFESRLALAEAGDLRLGGSLLSLRSDEQTNFQGSLSRQDISRVEGFVKGEYFQGDRISWQGQIYNHYYQRDREQYSGILGTWSSGDTERENILAGDLYATMDIQDDLMVVAGMEASLNTMERDVLTLGGRGGEVSRNGQALVVQGEWYHEGQHSLVLGMRVERDSRYGYAAAPRLAAMYYLAEELRLLGGLGLGYRAPDFNDLYLYNNQISAMPYTIAGNPDLDPEYSLGGNLGLEYVAGTFFFQINAYYTELYREIMYRDTGKEDTQSGKIIYRTENLDRSLRTGLDLEGRIGLGRRGYLSGAAGYLFAYNRSETSLIREEPFLTARGRWGFDDPARGLSFRLSGLYWSPLDPDERGSSGDHRYRLDLQGSKEIGQALSIFAAVENITGYINSNLGPYYGPLFTIGFEAIF
ncbi:outer membrane receptor for ferrienterochelin and colicins [Alkalispirochaeta americana]|uniref:Outer membrane receptor for ferrienterochelin and colicins n=1 Tax=Alkalispirochaeta americana TaxID=159291 RepID=A0A1N6Q6U8_9SPIO|nr:TonB-dependent receptor [Alkalispirochaeta americana]SIQ12290.1 outer membrane receptor for ferrienterochelin and colicins [Alkalispirochaeta americana]